VQQWIDSDYPFHVVRDHVLHNELMIGCLWAGPLIVASTRSIYCAARISRSSYAEEAKNDKFHVG